jgi:hypothetical protein
LTALTRASTLREMLAQGHREMIPDLAAENLSNDSGAGEAGASA